MSASLSELKKLPFWEKLSTEGQHDMAVCAQVRNYSKGELIYSHEHECLGLVAVLEGSVRIFMLSEEGREILLYRLHVGDTDVLSASCVINQITFETQMTAEDDCKLLIIPAVCLSRFKENDLNVRCYIFEKLGERFSDVMQQMQRMLFTRVDKRVADSLLRRMEESGSTVFSVTHEEIAGEINSSREVVSRILKDMERRNILKLGRGKITVLEKSLLEL